MAKHMPSHPKVRGSSIATTAAIGKEKMSRKRLETMVRASCTVVEHMTHHPHVGVSCPYPAAATGESKCLKEDFRQSM
jgi:hypothetical protein